MDQSIVTNDSNVSMKFAIGFGIIGFILITLLIFCCCCRTKNKDRRSSCSTIESFQQLYFTKTPFNQIKNIEQRVIERWSSVTQPSMTFYRVHMQDDQDNRYQPVNEERFHEALKQSKAQEYAGLEIIFF